MEIQEALWNDAKERAYEEVQSAGYNIFSIEGYKLAIIIAKLYYKQLQNIWNELKFPS